MSAPPFKTDEHLLLIFVQSYLIIFTGPYDLLVYYQVIEFIVYKKKK